MYGGVRTRYSHAYQYPEYRGYDVSMTSVSGELIEINGSHRRLIPGVVVRAGKGTVEDLLFKHFRPSCGKVDRVLAAPIGTSAEADRMEMIGA